MNDSSPETQDFFDQKIVNKPEYREQLEDRYRNQEQKSFFWICLLAGILLISSIAQFAILGYALEILFELDSYKQVLNIPIKTLISLLVTAFLPIASIIDASNILPERLKISFFGIIEIPWIWVLFLADIYLTSIAIFYVSEPVYNNSFITFTAFVIAAVFSTSCLFVSRAIVRNFSKWQKAIIDIKTVNLYGIDPKPLYKDAEQIKLSEEKEAAKQEAEEARQKLNKEKARYEEQLKSQKAEHTQKVQKLEGRLESYKEYSDSVSKLKTKFNRVKKTIVDLANQSKSFLSSFEKISTLDESVKELSFPSPPKVDISSDPQDNVIEKPTYYWVWENSDKSELPSKLSPVGHVILQAIQEQKLPRPRVREYSPIEGLAKCLVLDFDDYGVVVYCRDEELKEEGSQWTTEDDINFKSKLNDQQSSMGIYTLVFSSQEIMSHASKISEQIKNAIDSRIDNGF
ncbi:hypothetical protein BJP34_22635 [Moorena producens PAL-8-15-08-1]|uniref:Uncharacterized protein n=1 Tax=Moorena producens PAL-8-15-08-1 TaxID=1458985 RepID=A0A1D8TW30_9CYAN|nr:hypothetical protein [Moorena producens]AOX01860.1 hypothetical protein BJP34_22635 [Moorena producens PAL-8-15-08-1]